MRIIIENNEPEFIGLTVELSDKDLDQLIRQLTKLQAQPGQHFHLSTDGSGAFVDIAVCRQAPDAKSNAYGTGFAIGGSSDG